MLEMEHLFCRYGLYIMVYIGIQSKSVIFIGFYIRMTIGVFNLMEVLEKFHHTSEKMILLLHI